MGIYDNVDTSSLSYGGRGNATKSNVTRVSLRDKWAAEDAAKREGIKQIVTTAKEAPTELNPEETKRIGGKLDVVSFQKYGEQLAKGYTREGVDDVEAGNRIAGHIGAFKEAYVQADLGLDKSRLSYLVSEGLASEQDIIQRNELSAKIAASQQRTKDNPYVANAAGNIAPFIMESMEKGGKGYLKGYMMGAGLAAVAGQLGPQAGLPEEILTVPAFGHIGGKLVGIFESAENMREIEQGSAYETLDEAGVNHDIALWASRVYGGASAGLEFANLKILTKLLPGGATVAKEAMGRAVTKVIKNRAINAPLTVGKVATAEAVVETTQQFTENVIGELAKQINDLSEGTYLGAEDEVALWHEIIKGTGDTFLQTLVGMGVTAIPGTSVSFVVDTAHEIHIESTGKAPAATVETTEAPGVPEEPEAELTPEEKLAKAVKTGKEKAKKALAKEKPVEKPKADTSKVEAAKAAKETDEITTEDLETFEKLAASAGKSTAKDKNASVEKALAKLRKKVKPKNIAEEVLGKPDGKVPVPIDLPKKEVVKEPSITDLEKGKLDEEGKIIPPVEDATGKAAKELGLDIEPAKTKKDTRPEVVPGEVPALPPKERGGRILPSTKGEMIEEAPKGRKDAPKPKKVPALNKLTKKAVWEDGKVVATIEIPTVKGVGVHNDKQREQIRQATIDLKKKHPKGEIGYIDKDGNFFSDAQLAEAKIGTEEELQDATPQDKFAKKDPVTGEMVPQPGPTAVHLGKKGTAAEKARLGKLANEKKKAEAEKGLLATKLNPKDTAELKRIKKNIKNRARQATSHKPVEFDDVVSEANIAAEKWIRTRKPGDKFSVKHVVLNAAKDVRALVASRQKSSEVTTQQTNEEIGDTQEAPKLGTGDEILVQRVKDEYGVKLKTAPKDIEASLQELKEKIIAKRTEEGTGLSSADKFILKEVGSLTPKGLLNTKGMDPAKKKQVIKEYLAKQKAIADVKKGALYIETAESEVLKDQKVGESTSITRRKEGTLRLLKTLGVSDEIIADVQNNMSPAERMEVGKGQDKTELAQVRASLKEADAFWDVSKATTMAFDPADSTFEKNKSGNHWKKIGPAQAALNRLKKKDPKKYEFARVKRVDKNKYAIEIQVPSKRTMPDPGGAEAPFKSRRVSVDDAINRRVRALNKVKGLERKRELEAVRLEIIGQMLEMGVTDKDRIKQVLAMYDVSATPTEQALATKQVVAKQNDTKAEKRKRKAAEKRAKKVTPPTPTTVPDQATQGEILEVDARTEADKPSTRLPTAAEEAKFNRDAAKRKKAFEARKKAERKDVGNKLMDIALRGKTATAIEKVKEEPVVEKRETVPSDTVSIDDMNDAVFNAGFATENMSLAEIMDKFDEIAADVTPKKSVLERAADALLNQKGEMVLRQGKMRKTLSEADRALLQARKDAKLSKQAPARKVDTTPISQPKQYFKGSGKKQITDADRAALEAFRQRSIEKQKLASEKRADAEARKPRVIVPELDVRVKSGKQVGPRTPFSDRTTAEIEQDFGVDGPDYNSTNPYPTIYNKNVSEHDMALYKEEVKASSAAFDRANRSAASQILNNERGGADVTVPSATEQIGKAVDIAKKLAAVGKQWVGKKYDIIDVEAKWKRMKADATGLAVKTFHSIQALHEDIAAKIAVDIVKSVRKNTGLKGDAMAESLGDVVLGAEREATFQSWSAEKQAQLGQAVAMLREYFDNMLLQYEESGITDIDYYKGVIAKYRKSMGKMKDINKMNEMNRRLAELEQLKFVHLPRSQWFPQATTDTRTKSQMERAKKRRAYDILVAKRHRTLVSMQDLLDNGTLEKKELDPVSMLLNYGAQVGRDMAMVNVREAGIEDGMVSDAKTKPFSLRALSNQLVKMNQDLVDLTNPAAIKKKEAAIIKKEKEISTLEKIYNTEDATTWDKMPSQEYSAFKGLWVDTRLRDALNTTMAVDDRQGWYEKQVSLVKMAQFYNPIFMPMYDVWQAGVMGGLAAHPSKWAKAVYNGIKDVNTMSERHQRAAQWGTFSKPFSNPLGNRDRQVRAIQQASEHSGVLGSMWDAIRALGREQFTTAALNKENRAILGVPVGGLYNAAWNAAWTMDAAIRQGTFNYLTEQGMSDKEAAQTAAKIHADYAGVPATTRKALNKVIFTPTFAISMVKVQTAMINEAIRFATRRSQTGSQKQLALGAMTMTATIIGLHMGMIGMGYEPEKWGRSYKKTVWTSKGPREIKINLTVPFTKGLKYLQWLTDYAVKPAVGAGESRTRLLQDFMRTLSYEGTPLLRTIMGLSKNIQPNGDKIFLDNDDPHRKVAKQVWYVMKDVLAFTDQWQQKFERETAEDNKALLGELGMAFRVLSRMQLVYVSSRSPREQRFKGQMNALKRDFQTDLQQVLKRDKLYQLDTLKNNYKDRMRKLMEDYRDE